MTRMIFAAAVTVILSSGAFAKGHDQRSSAFPGEDVCTETVTVAQLLGGILGERPDDAGPMGQ